MLLANAYIYEMEGPSFYERWTYWVSRTPEQRLWSAVKNEIEKLFRQAHFAVSIALQILKKIWYSFIVLTSSVIGLRHFV